MKCGFELHGFFLEPKTAYLEALLYFDFQRSCFTGHPKGQLISKQNCRAVTSRRRKNGRMCFYILTTLKYLKLEIEIQVSSIFESSG